MAEIVNLRRARKDRARREADTAAAANRAAFGRTPPPRDAQEAEKSLQARKLDGHRRDIDHSDE